MADWERRTRREYVLPNPTNWVEVGKVIDAINGELASDPYGDTVTVSATDGEIVFSYLAPEAGS